MFKKYCCIFVLAFFFFYHIAAGQNASIYTQDNGVTSPFQNKGYLTNSDDIADKILLLKSDINNQLKNKETSKAISSLLVLSDLYANNAQYGQSYDGYWRALLLSDQIKDSSSMALTYHGLGWLYSLFRREEKAIEYFNLSLAINKQLVKKKDINEQSLIRDYYALAILYRKEKNIKKARLYIDSCRKSQNKALDNSSGNAYFNAEDGYLSFLENKFQPALEKLNQSRSFFEKFENHPYLIILYSFYGDVYKQMKEYDTSSDFYKNALKIIDKTKMHVDIKPDLYENLADVDFLKGDYLSAYNYLQEAKKVTEQQFGSRSNINKELLEIKDDYRLAKEKQKLEQLEIEKKIGNLKATIYAGGLIFLLILGFILYRYLRTRYKIEKALLQKKQELEINKAREILEIKNKELTASTLRIIEKDEILADLKEKLKDQKKNPNPEELNKIMKSIDATNANNWEEFDASFSSVNESFYHSLVEQFPEITHNDKKICALIKLNFSSKDMARLLGISIESVHTTRYRLRKKLNLSRETNLYEFIQNI